MARAILRFLGIANLIPALLLFSVRKVVRRWYPLEAEEVAALSPYLTHHINRFGRYDLDMEKRPPELVYDHGVSNGGILKEALSTPDIV